MDISNNSIERLCKVFGYLDSLEGKEIDFVSSIELAQAVGATEYTIRKDISLLELTGYNRKGYEVRSFKKQLGKKLNLDKRRKACIVGLGRLGAALLNYENFKENGFEIVAGFDRSINKIERIRTEIELFPINRLNDVIKSKVIELGIVAVPAESAQGVVDQLSDAGIKGILNFSPIKIIVPKNIIHLDMDFTNALRIIAVQLCAYSE